MSMDEKDQQIVDLIQTALPVDVRPYARIGEAVGLPESEVIDRIKSLKERNIIRRVGALVEPRKVGYVSSLIAAKIEPDKIPQAVEKINAYVGVTHNYHRENYFNVWFTLIARGAKKHADILDTIRGFDGVLALHSLPATKIFKLKVNFKAGEDNANGTDK
jgi:DNA-binding Lrp family transcriptional regulator